MVAGGGVASLALAVFLVLPALAETQPAASHHTSHRHHYYYPTLAYGHRDVDATLHEVDWSPFYGPLGAYEDSYAAWQFPGPNQRRYFGYGFDPRYGYGP
jgi:hypothetical protein